MNASVSTYVADLAPAPQFKDLDEVRLLRSVSTDEGIGIPAGAIGTIVAVWPAGVAYEVEFSAVYQGLATVGIEDLELERTRA